ncbi:MAG: hypothetical protein ACFE8M_10770 [Candidatus Hermodarchaeota archaeon]
MIEEERKFLNELVEEESKFVEFLHHQINQKNTFDKVVRKIPLFKNKIQDCHYTILKMIDTSRRDVYDMLVQEFNNILTKK